MKSLEFTINTHNEIQHNTISHFPILFSLTICLLLFIKVFPAQFLLLFASWCGRLVTDQDSMQLPHSPLFCDLFCGKHLSSKWIDVGGKISIWSGHCCRITMQLTSRIPFLETGRRWCTLMPRFKPNTGTKTVTSLHDISNPSPAGSMHALQIDGHWQV